MALVLNALFKVVLAVSLVFFGFTHLAFALPAQVEVTIGASQEPISELIVFGPLQICGSQTISLGEGRYQLRIRNALLQLAQLRNAKREPVPEKVYYSAPQIVFKGLRNGYLKIERGRLIRAYPGVLVVSISHDKSLKTSATNAKGEQTQAPHMMLVNRVTRADYIAGVCAAELPKEARLEAIKAQAVLVNGIVARMGANAKIDDTTQIAAYAGVVTDRPEVKLAVKAVGDQMLRFDHRPIHPYFHSTCAGHTGRGCDVFQIDKRYYPYLESVQCHYCKKSPFWKHTISVIPWAEYAKVFGNREPTVDKRDEAGRALEVSVGAAGSSDPKERIVISAYNFWTEVGQKFGWNVAPGNIFALHKKGDYLEFDSRGGGHGVGMCQWGAMGMAEAGKTYEEILHHYFPHAKLSKQ